MIFKLTQLAAELYSSGAEDLAATVAKIAVDLTKDSEEPLTLSSGSASIGDALRLRETVKKDRYTIPKDTKGYLVGFTAEGLYLCLLFPTSYPDGMLSLHTEKELHILHKPQVADDHLFAK